MEVPACCPICDEPFRWELDLAVEQEIAWMAPNAPAFAFCCAGCGGHVEITFRWSLERGDHPRALTLVGGATPLPSSPQILLVDRCPHGCGLKLGLQLSPDHPWAWGVSWPDEADVIGGYRCPRCDGEGRLRICPVVQAGGSR